MQEPLALLFSLLPSHPLGSERAWREPGVMKTPLTPSSLAFSLQGLARREQDTQQGVLLSIVGQTWKYCARP